MAADDTNTLIVKLLNHWPRAVLQAAIQASPDPFTDLHSGALLAWLEEQAASRQLATPLGYSTPPDLGMLGWFDPRYPEVLRHIPDPPLLLYYKGTLEWLGMPTVAIVGSRRATGQGKEFAASLAAGLAASGVHVISGLAYGIDAAAHHGALRGQGISSACLGSGLHNLYPARHANLASRLVDAGGALISEYPLTQPPLAYQFPERNRLISGFSNAVIVVEASERSGSLITARLALEQGRDVLAVPGPVNSFVSRGAHRLLKQGAALVTEVDDVLDMLNLDGPDVQPASRRQPEGDGGYVFALLNAYPTSLDELVALSGWPAGKLLGVLARLELEEFVRSSGDGYIARSFD